MRKFFRDVAVVAIALVLAYALIHLPRWTSGVRTAWNDQTVQKRQADVDRITGCDTNPNQDICKPKK